ncbi:MAG: MBL fold metallo-hydrolase [Kordiimonadaceae bacterium]|nr:MBL fold metallo-hydrolase [Kordiimonadaceae bacterium]
MPSPVAAAKLMRSAVYNTEIRLLDGISYVLARNPKAYTGPGTNTYIVGKASVWVVDPGPYNLAHCSAVLNAIDGRPVKGILVTHTHLDHSPAADILKRMTGAKTYGFGGLCTKIPSETKAAVDPSFVPDVALSHDHIIGVGRWRVEAVHTPGHSPDHLCYSLPEQSVLFSGDHVMGWSSTVIAPPLGNLADYMASLTLLENCNASLMLPSHGGPVEDPRGRIGAIRDHRLMRHRQVADCLAEGLSEPADIVARIYRDLTPHLIEAAQGCVRAHMDTLRNDTALA